MARDIYEATIEKMNNDSLLQGNRAGVSGSMASTDTTNNRQSVAFSSFSSARGLKVKDKNNSLAKPKTKKKGKCC
jgi:hypothetical protein